MEDLTSNYYHLTRSFPVTSHLIPGRPICVPLNISTHFWSFWVPLLAFETLMCSLALFRGFQSYKRHEILNGDSTVGSRLLQILIRDSILYFIVYVFVLSEEPMKIN